MTTDSKNQEPAGVGGWLVVYILTFSFPAILIIIAFILFGEESFSGSWPSSVKDYADITIWILAVFVPISVFFTGRSWVVIFNRAMMTVLAVASIATINPVFIGVSIAWAVYWYRSQRVRNTYNN